MQNDILKGPFFLQTYNMSNTSKSPIAPAVSERIAKFNKLFGGEAENEDLLVAEENKTNVAETTSAQKKVESVVDKSSPTNEADSRNTAVDPGAKNRAAGVQKRAGPSARATANSTLNGDGPQSDGEEGEHVAEEQNDQFMRIQVAATNVKPAHKVKKDKFHDRPDKKRTGGPGFSRMLSSVKAPDLGHTRPSLAAVGRMLSLSREKKSAAITPPSAASLNTVTSPVSDKSVGSQTSSVSFEEPSKSVHNRRRGRMNGAGTDRRRNLLTRTFSMAARPTAPAAQEAERAKVASMGDRSKSAVPPRRSIGSIGRMLSLNRTRSSVTDFAPKDERDVTSDASSPGVSKEKVPVRQPQNSLKRKASRMSLRQVGRLLSRSRDPPKDGLVTSPISDVSSRPSPRSAVSPALHSEQPIVSPKIENERPPQNEVQSGPATGLNRTMSTTRGLALSQVGRLLSTTKKRRSAGPAVAKEEHDIKNQPLQKRLSNVNFGGDDLAKTHQKGPNELQYFFVPLLSHVAQSTEPLKGQTHFRAPVLHMSPYLGPASTTSWHTDIITLSYNAARREMVDFYSMMTAMARKRPEDDIKRKDLINIQQLWNGAYGFFAVLFSMEAKILYPWITKAVQKHGNTDNHNLVQVLAAERENVWEEFEIVLEVIRRAGTNPPGEIFAELHSTMENAVRKMEKYFRRSEEKLAEVLRKHSSLNDSQKLEKDITQAFIGVPLGRKTKDVPRLNIIILVRWIQNPRQLKAWIAKNLNSTAKSAFPKWKQKFEEDHRSIVNQYHVRDDK